MDFLSSEGGTSSFRSKGQNQTRTRSLEMRSQEGLRGWKTDTKMIDEEVTEEEQTGIHSQRVVIGTDGSKREVDNERMEN